MNLEESTFQIGDIVRLRSGGPRMTIVDKNVILEEVIECSWFSAKGKHQDAALKGFYPPRALQLITEASPSDSTPSAAAAPQKKEKA